MRPIFPMRKSTFFCWLNPYLHPIFVQGILLCKVLNYESVSESFGYISNSKEEKLLISIRICVRPHVKMIKSVRNFNCSAKISRFKITVELKCSREFWFVLSRRFDQLCQDLIFCEYSIINLLTLNVSLEGSWELRLFEFAFSKKCLNITFLQF